MIRLTLSPDERAAVPALRRDATLTPVERDRALYWVAKPGSLRAHHLIACLTELPVAPVPTVVVLDNGAIHRSKDTRAAIPDLRARGVYLHFLPPYSPELNDIEAAFRAIKHAELPERAYTTVPALLDAVDTAVATYEERRITKYRRHPRPAA
jgi:putative transposase